MKPELEEDDDLCDLLELLLVDAVLCVQTGFSTIGEELVEVVDVETLVDVDENRVVDVLTTDVEVLTKDVLVDLQKDEIYFFCQKNSNIPCFENFPSSARRNNRSRVTDSRRASAYCSCASRSRCRRGTDRINWLSFRCRVAAHA